MHTVEVVEQTRPEIRPRVIRKRLAAFVVVGTVLFGGFGAVLATTSSAGAAVSPSADTAVCNATGQSQIQCANEYVVGNRLTSGQRTCLARFGYATIGGILIDVIKPGTPAKVVAGGIIVGGAVSCLQSLEPNL